MKRLFSLHKEEQWFALVAFLLFATLNALVVARYADFGLTPGDRSIMANVRLAGFDPYFYGILTTGGAYYDALRHPLLFFFLQPLYYLNLLLGELTGTNCAIPLTAVLNVVCATWAAIFFHRTLRLLLRLNSIESATLTALLFSFAYILLATMAPDHFNLSLFLLTMTLYIAGKHLAEHKPLGRWLVAILFLLTAGTTLTNGVKTILTTLFTNGKKIFRPAFFTVAFLLPIALFTTGAYYVYKEYTEPYRQAAKAEEVRKMAKFPQKMKKRNELRAKFRKKHQGEPLVKDVLLLEWSDVTTPRGATIVENLWGESFMLHDDHLLGDVLVNRPIFVANYRLPLNYGIELLLALLFLLGIWCGRHSRLLWMALSWMAFDMVVHLGFGFGINEIYIMAAHWAFVIPLTIAFAVSTAARRKRLIITGLCALIAVFLFSYNGYYLYQFLFPL